MLHQNQFEKVKSTVFLIGISECFFKNSYVVVFFRQEILKNSDDIFSFDEYQLFLSSKVDGFELFSRILKEFLSEKQQSLPNIEFFKVK